MIQDTVVLSIDGKHPPQLRTVNSIDINLQPASEYANEDKGLHLVN